MSGAEESFPHSLSLEDERDALSRAYVPEHIVGLMTRVSKANPFLIDNFLGFARDNWLILVGYPLVGEFALDRCGEMVQKSLEVYQPEYLWFIGPEIPDLLLESCRERQSDEYYRLEVEGFQLRSALRRAVKRAAEVASVERVDSYTREHRSLAAEFMRRQKLPPMVAGLYEAMPEYVGHAEDACVLNARDPEGRLSAFYVVDLAAEAFDTYVLGCYSRKHHTPYASDYLFNEMIQLARQRGKKFINLGLGVNAGIRRFKMKWGGKAYLKYEFCECHYGRSQASAALDFLLEGRL
jgi:hypothetical protein